MATVPTINCFDGGTHGTTITEANSGGASGDGFNTVSVGGGATMAYDNTHTAHGLLSAKIATTTSASPFLAWTSARLGKLTTSWVRFYLYMPAAPTVNHRLLNCVAAGFSRCGLTMMSTGKIRTVNAAGGMVQESAVIPFGQWIRIELKIVADASSGQLVLRIFNSLDSTTPDQTLTSAASQALGGTYVDGWRFGVTGSVASVPAFWLDEISVSADDWLGPFDPYNHTIIDGAVFSDTRPVEASIERSVLFDSAQYVEIDDHPDFSIATTGAFTVSALVRPDSLWMSEAEGGPNSRDYVHYLGKGETSSPWADGDQEWTLRMYQQGNSENRANRFSAYAFNLRSPAPGESNLGNGSYFQDQIVPGRWLLITATWDGTYVRIYCDGVKRDEDLLDQSAVPGWEVEIIPEDGPAPVRIGTRDLNSFFQGSISRVAFWNRALSDADIAGLQASRATGTYDTYVGSTQVAGLKGFYKLNEPDGSTVAVDSSPAGHHGVYAKAVISETPGAVSAQTEETDVARLLFGDQIQDFAINIGAANSAVLTGGATVTFWNDRTAGEQYTDLLTTGGAPIASVTTSLGSDGRTIGSIPAFQGPDGVFELWAQAAVGDSPAGARQLMTANNMGSYLADLIASTGGGGGGGGGGPVSPTTLQLQVPADGVTDAAPTIQTALNNLASSAQSYHVVIDGATKGTIYLNSQVQIKTSNTRVTFAAPILMSMNADSSGDGSGALSIMGTAGTATTVSSGAIRGSSKVVVASTTNIALKQLIRIHDSDAGTGSSAVGHKSELAEVVDISGTTLYLDHPLHHTYSGTITLTPINAVSNSGYDGVNVTFSGQQPEGFRFPAKMMYVRHCYFRNMHFRGDPSNSWSRECFSVRRAYRCTVEACSASFSWDYTVGTTHDYGFSTDESTGCQWRGCWASNVRHAFTADKGSCGALYLQCVADNATASAFDLHGGWVRDISYVACVATASETRNSADTTKTGFLAGNTSYRTGAHYISYVGCTARNYGPYTPHGGAVGSGESAGFGVVDGSTNITIQASRMVDCQMGVRILSQSGTQIGNVSIMGCEFNGIGDISGGGATSLPIFVNAGAAPNDVDGLLIQGNTFVRCSQMASARIYGTSGNQLANVRVLNNSWLGAGVSGVWPVDIRYVDNPIVAGNLFDRTRRGVRLLASPNAAVVKNVFYKLVDGSEAANVIHDGGGNTNLLFRGNELAGFTPSSWGTAPSSSGAVVEKPATGVALV